MKAMVVAVGRGTDNMKPITHVSELGFVDFIDLFKAFAVRCRKVI